MTFNIFVLLAVISGLTYVSAFRSSIGKAEEDQTLLWTEHKLSPVYSEKRDITHVFVFDGEDRNVERITQITFDYVMDSVSIVVGGGRSTNNATTSFGCTNCSYFSVTEHIYGFYKK